MVNAPSCKWRLRGGTPEYTPTTCSRPRDGGVATLSLQASESPRDRSHCFTKNASVSAIGPPPTAPNAIPVCAGYRNAAICSSTFAILITVILNLLYHWRGCRHSTRFLFLPTIYRGWMPDPGRVFFPFTLKLRYNARKGVELYRIQRPGLFQR